MTIEMEVTKGEGILSVFRPIMAQGTGLEAESELGDLLLWY